jgi:imidazole glycerol-phosphate synthase subunit HisH
MRNNKIVIVDYGVGNLASLINLLGKFEYEITISKKKNVLKNADCLILPGVGNFTEAIRNLKKNKIFLYLKKLILAGKPTIGICLGMQILFKSSEESAEEIGLGILSGKIIKLKKKNIGWFKIFSKKKDPYFKKINNKLFYFNHSYGFKGVKNSYESYIKDLYPYLAIVKNKNVLGIQFHPEKSQYEGENFLKNILLDKNFIKKIH